MKKLLPILLALLLLLTACGGSNSAKSADSMDMAASTGDRADFGWAADDMAPMEPEEAPEANYSGKTESAAPDPMEDGSVLPADAKMIYTADLSLESRDFDAAAKALDELVESLGGYYESRSLDQGGRSRSLSCTIRVPAENFRSLLTQAGEAAHVTNCYEYIENVSEAYYDTEARLKTQQIKLDRLHALLEKAATMEDIISLENALSETELQIEYLTGSLRRYDSLIGYSTVHADLYEVYKLSTDEAVPVSFGQRISAAFAQGIRRGADNAEDFVIFLVRNWISILVWAVVISAAVLVLRRRRNKKLAARSAEKPAPGGEEAPKN